MLRTRDVMAAKIAVQLQVVGADDARALLRALDAGQAGAGDFVNHAATRFRLDPRLVETVRHRAALYEHVREEAVFLRLLERAMGFGRDSVATLLAQLEAQPHRRRLGEALVRAGRLPPEKDKELQRQARASIEQDDARIMDRYRQEDFAGVMKPLIRGSRLDPADFKISTLFRSKETRALVDQIDLQALREEARRAREAPAPPPAPAAAAPPVATPSPAGAPALAGMDQVSKLKRIADYTIVEVLGVGGMGAVFLGQKDGRGEYCAIKVMLNQAAGKTELGRFRRELALMARIDHPNVLALLDSGDTPEGLTYLVVPALAGKELRAHIDAAGAAGLTPPLVIKVFKQVLEGMDAVHRLGIVHRDLKPENIFVRAGGEEEVKIMDFGLAKLADGADEGGQEDCFRSDAGEVVGSPAYIAPESITNDAIDARTDIYSLGIILFEMLTGKLPLESETAQGYLGQHLVCPPLTLAEAQPGRRWPQALEDLLARMMGKTKDERPASCAEVLEAFRGVAVPLLRMDVGSKEVPTVAPIEVAAAQAAAAQPKQEPGGWGFKGLMGRLRR
ncbi:MAG: serine/threonine protein kinase [Planctomycetes bacterium]|nr:serine/threonine protein kinase [Planctomycetota bacterium]